MFRLIMKQTVKAKPIHSGQGWITNEEKWATSQDPRSPRIPELHSKYIGCL